MDCDNCLKKDKGDIESRDITDISKALVNFEKLILFHTLIQSKVTAVVRMERGVSNRFTTLQLVEVWRGGKSAKALNLSFVFAKQ